MPSNITANINTAELASTADDHPPLAGMIGSSSAMKTVYARVRKAAPTRSTILIHGETGSGKELVARGIHQASDRHSQPFIAVNCAAIPETLIEAELFGHEKGAFTGAASKRSGLIEAAEGGTLCCALQLQEIPSVVHDHIQVHVGAAVFAVVEIQKRGAINEAHGHGGHLSLHGIAAEAALLH